PLHQIGQADGKLDDALVVAIFQWLGDDAGLIKNRPKRIAPSGVVMPRSHGRLRRVASHDHELHSFAEVVRQSLHGRASSLYTLEYPAVYCGLSLCSSWSAKEAMLCRDRVRSPNDKQPPQPPDPRQRSRSI